MGDFFDELEGDFFDELDNIGDRPRTVGDVFSVKKAYPNQWEGQQYVVGRIDTERHEHSGPVRTYSCRRVGTDDWWFMTEASIQRTVRDRGFRILKNGDKARSK